MRGQGTRWRRNPKGWVAVFFIALTLIGLLTVDDYGAPYDELSEMLIIRANLQEYAVRLEGRDGKSVFSRMNFPPMSEYIERDHGICGYYLLAPFLPYAVMSDIHHMSTLWSVLTWLWFMLGCFSLYSLMRCLGVSRVLSCCSVLLLYLYPRFFAEGHYNNKDVVLLSFVLFTLWTGARFLDKPGFGRGLLFSLAGAMATNTKIIGALPWGLIGLAAVLLISVNRQWSLKMAGVALSTIAAYLCFFALLTPALWDDPLKYLEYVLVNATQFSRFGGVVLFRGADFYDVQGTTPLPWYYLPYYLLVSIPLYTLALAALGQVRALRLFFQKPRAVLGEYRTVLLLVCSLSWLVPLGYAMATRPLLYNGWRHFYFLYAGIASLAGFGLHTLWELVQRRPMLRRLCAALLCVCLLATGIGLALNHPYQFAYFNPLVRRDARRTMDLDTWNVAAAGAFERLYHMKHEQEPQLRVGCYFNDITIGAFKLPAPIRDSLVITAERDEPYLYYNATYAYIYWAQEPPEGYHILFEVKSYGNTIGVMYEKDGHGA
ncbi:MAG: hypothetical protein VB099_01080 [Candidatus Limiplasma sp.]|nr:hypothetical protein [Candidatus Limiplasma sp.]